MTAVLAVVVASGLWIAGLNIGRDRTVDRRVLEYWWALGIFFFGGVGTVAAIIFKSLTLEQGIALRAAPLILLGLVLVARTVWSRRAFVPPAGFALLVYFGISFTGDGLIMPLLSLIAYLPALIVPAVGYDLDSLRAGAAMGISIFLLLLVGLSVLQPQLMLGPCRSFDKCSYWGVALGPLTTGNALGMYLAAASAVTLLGGLSWHSVLLSLPGSLALIHLTASRSGLFAFYVIVGICVAHFWAQRLRSRAPVIIATLVACIATVALPLMNWSAMQFTYRPVLWWQAWTLFSDSPFIGYGPSYWVRDESTFNTGSNFAVTTNYSTHNIAMEILVSVGALGAVAFVLALILASTSGRNFTAAVYTIALVGIFAALSLAEVTAAPGRVYLFDGIGVYLFVAASAIGAVCSASATRSNRWEDSTRPTAPLARSANFRDGATSIR